MAAAPGVPQPTDLRCVVDGERPCGSCSAPRGEWCPYRFLLAEDAAALIAAIPLTEPRREVWRPTRCDA